MSRLVSIAALLLFVGIALPTSAQAQADLKIGPRIGVPVGDVSDAGGNFFFGADLRLSTVALPVVPNASFDFYLVDSDQAIESIYAVDLNALYEFGIANQVFTPYAGGGLGITGSSVENADGDTELGVNIVGGARFLIEPIEPFVQVNATLGSDLNRAGIAGGVLIGF